MDDDTALASSRKMVDGLRVELARRCRGPVALVETHISWVLLDDRFAYKVKKPVRLPFADFSEMETRKRLCDEELRLNRRMAPQLYLDVLAVHGPAQAPSFQGKGPVIDHAVRMLRFPAGALLSERWAAGQLRGCQIDRFARCLAAFHAGAPLAEAKLANESPRVIAELARQAVQAVESHEGLGDGARGLGAWIESSSGKLRPAWAARAKGGRVRDVHGDLHMGNVVMLEGGEVVAFDCIEFDPKLRCIDVLSDAAFPAMDLWAHGRADLAFRFLNAYLDETGDHGGLPLLRFYMVYRALVRADVALIREAQGGQREAGPGAVEYVELAQRLVECHDPRLLITHGLPGSGKTFTSQQLMERSGAIRLRSDVERKRLFGLAPNASSNAIAGGIYTADATERTYARLHELARVSLQSGFPTIVDAAFLMGDQRASFASLARELGVPFNILHCEAGPETLRDRLRRRESSGVDASEADEAVLERLRSRGAGTLEESELASVWIVESRCASPAEAIAGRWAGAAGACPPDGPAQSQYGP